MSAKKKIDSLEEKLDKLIEAIKKAEKSQQKTLSEISEVYRKSARNLIHYYALRSFDITDVQLIMGHLGMSRLARAESHVLGSLLNSKLILSSIRKVDYVKPKSGLSIKNGQRLLEEHTEAVLGKPVAGRRVRIMVTMPSEAAHNFEMVQKMVASGMNCARINCAHDGPKQWLQMIQYIRKAAEENGRMVKITMDLAGPKIRTGPIAVGPRVKKFKPSRDDLGQVINPFALWLVADPQPELNPNEIPVPEAFIEGITLNDVIVLRDTRGKKRKLPVISMGEKKVLVHGNQTVYLESGSNLWLKGRKKVKAIVGNMPAKEESILLKEGEKLILHKKQKPGEAAQYDGQGNCIQKAHIACTLPNILDQVKTGEHVFFDDGKIAGKIIAQDKESVEIEISRAEINGSRLKAEKGINFPESDLKINGLTPKDREDLKFIAENADVVNYSFVNTRADVEDLILALQELKVKNSLSVILKIETQKAFRNLKSILLTAMQVHYVGVMIARGDLAVESGWKNIGLIQKEIVKITSAAHLPVIWATQVLENLAKKGYPSRSEITDVTSGIKAECVMLNKGPYINRAIELLDEILVDMEPFQVKNIDMLPKLNVDHRTMN